jgi:hypothetical protein
MSTTAESTGVKPIEQPSHDIGLRLTHFHSTPHILLLSPQPLLLRGLLLPPQLLLIQYVQPCLILLLFQLCMHPH